MNRASANAGAFLYGQTIRPKTVNQRADSNRLKTTYILKGEEQ